MSKIWTFVRKTGKTGTTFKLLLSFDKQFSRFTYLYAIFNISLGTIYNQKILAAQNNSHLESLAIGGCVRFYFKISVDMGRYG